MHYNKTKQQFLFCNSSTPHAFVSESTLKILSENHHWNADGRFRTSAALFTQAYYIHVWDEYSMKPAVKINHKKNMNIYFDYAAQKTIMLNPSSILIDFEKAVPLMQLIMYFRKH